MRIGLVLFLVSIVTVSPVLVALVEYRENLAALFMPTESTMTSIRDLGSALPSLEYLSYEVIDPAQPRAVRINFKVSNALSSDVTINSVKLTAYCHDHGTFLGYVSAENVPLVVPAEASVVLRLRVDFSQEGRNDVETYHRGYANLYLDLKNLEIDIQGLEISFSEFSQVGPIGIPVP